MTITTINRFNENNPLTREKINENFQALMALINTLAGEVVVQFNNAPGNDGSQFVPKTGGAFFGQITAPSLLVGPNEGTKHPVLTTDSAATEAVRGAVRMAAEVADLTQSISNPPTQSEVQAIQAKVNALLAALRTAGMVAT